MVICMKVYQKKIQKSNMKLTKINLYDKDKNGKLYYSEKTKRNYTRMVIEVEEKPGKSLSGFLNEETKNWKVGDEVDIIITEKGEYLNFSLPKKDSVNGKALEVIQNTLLKQSFVLNQMHEALKQIQKVVVKDTYPYPETLGYKAEDMANFDKKEEPAEAPVDDDEIPF